MHPFAFAATLMLFAYLFASISTAVLVSRAMNLPDPRRGGSHNPGATNVLRLGGKRAAVITLLGDFAKGALPLALARGLGADDALLAALGVCAFLGHLYPLFFRFRGGKGVATAGGVLCAAHLALGGAVMAVWLGVAFLFRYSSLAALTASLAAAPFAWWLLPNTPYWLMALLIGALLIWRHRANIRRLVNGEEGKIVLSSKRD